MLHQAPLYLNSDLKALYKSVIIIIILWPTSLWPIWFWPIWLWPILIFCVADMVFCCGRYRLAVAGIVVADMVAPPEVLGWSYGLGARERQSCPFFGNDARFTGLAQAARRSI